MYTALSSGMSSPQTEHVIPSPPVQAFPQVVILGLQLAQLTIKTSNRFTWHVLGVYSGQFPLLNG